MNTEGLFYHYPYRLTEVPIWCQMPPSDHQDGMGGCWSISHGFLLRDGEANCKVCEYRKGKNDESRE